MATNITKNLQYFKFSLYGFLKNLRFFDAFLILFFLDRGLSFVEIGLLYSIREITLVLVEIPSGVIADTLGRRRILIISFALYITSFILFFLSANFMLFAFAMLVFAFGDAFRTGVHKAMIFNYLKVNDWPDQKVDYYGHTRSWSQIGTAISALIAGFIVFYSGNYDLIFLASGIPYFINMLNIWSYPKFLDGDHPTFSYIVVKNQFKEIISAFIHSFKNIYFLKVLTSNNLNTGFYRAVKDYIQPLLKSFALSLPVLAYLSDEKKVAIIIGTAYFFIYLLTALLTRKSGTFIKFFKTASKPMNITILIALISGVITGLMFSIGYFIIAIIGFVVILAIENLRKPIGVALVADLTKDKAMASVLSASSQAKSIIAAILAPLIGWIADMSDPGMGIAVVSFTLIFLIPLYWLKRPFF